MKKLFCVLLALCMLPLAVPAFAGDPVYEIGRVAGAHYSLGETVVNVKVFKNHPWEYWGDTPSDAENMIRSDLQYHTLRENGFRFPEDTESAWERLDLIRVSDDWTEFTIRLKEPGAYYLWGVEFFVLDPADEMQAEFARSLEEAVSKCTGKNETETARKLEAWVDKNVVYPNSAWLFGGDDGSTEMIETTGTAYGVWATGRATCGGYSHYYSLLCSVAGIECVLVSGDANSGGHTWVLNRLDGVWSFTDPTWDDSGSGSKNRYFALSKEKMDKDHTLYDHSKAFWTDLIATTPFDREVNLYDTRNGLSQSVPRSLLTLPATAEGYGFPAADDPKAIRVENAEISNDLVVYKLNRKTEYSRVEFYVPGSGFDLTDKQISTAKSNGDRVELTGSETSVGYISIYASDNLPSTAEVKKGASVRAYYVDGERAGSESTFTEPLAAGSQDNCIDGSWRSWTTDGDGTPLYATWYILTRKAEHTVTVYFDADGAVSRYTVRFAPLADPEMKSTWVAHPDGTVVSASLQGEGAEDTGILPRIRFE